MLLYAPDPPGIAQRPEYVPTVFTDGFPRQLPDIAYVSLTRIVLVTQQATQAKQTANGSFAYSNTHDRSRTD